MPEDENDDEIDYRVAMNSRQKWTEVISRYSNQKVQKDDNYVKITSTIINSGPFER